RVLAMSLALAFVLRYGGMALPQSVIIDMPWHMKWLRTLLAGDWQSLYFPGGLSSVPREWGLDLLIPKSPLFYFAASPLGFLPFDLDTLVKWLICFIDSTLVFAAFWLILRVGGAKWAAVLAYYGLYVSPVLASAAALLSPQPGGGSTVRWPGGFAQLLAWTVDYLVSVLPALLALLGLALLLSRRWGGSLAPHATRTLWLV